MRTFTRLFSLLAAFLLPFSLLANVYVHGTVKRANGTPVPNYEVRIETDSTPNTPAACRVLHVKLTNPNGFYDDTLICNSSVARVIVSIKDCNGTVIRHEHALTPTNQGAESNFTICDLPVVCQAYFLWERIPGTNRIHFNSTASITTANDSIISRKWKFGDGDSLTGNVVSPEHTYAQPGNYTACLITKTSHGCESSICKLVVIQPLNITCEANFSFLVLNTTSTGFPVHFNSTASHTSPGDSIFVRRWTFGDGTTGLGVDPVHVYTQPGNYTVCLRIESALGCGDSTCTTVHIVAPPAPHCEAVYTLEYLPAPPAGSNTALHYVRFNSANSHGGTPADSVVSRNWNFGDGSGTTTVNAQVSPVHGYAQGGQYNVCLYILTQSGCRDTVCHTVTIPAATPNCEPRFTTSATGLSVVFNSSSSSVPAGDSIISRSWTFGDGSSAGNTVTVTHQYANVGTYNACLTTHTRLGCVKTWCKTVSVINISGTCVPYFTHELTATARTLRFNSIASYSQLPNDSITGRKWEFGDGQILTGNVINPLHTYALGGTYNVCLTIYTLHCDKRWCQTVQALPITNGNQTDSLSIVNLYPIPVNTQLNAVIYSGRFNVTAELAIYDVYGVRKWYQTVVLPFGNSTYNIPTSQLATGPYIFKVTTQYGVRSRNFFKIN